MSKNELLNDKLLKDRVEVKVTLQNAELEIWRVFESTTHINLDVLHEAFQIAFGFNSRHLHNFTTLKPEELFEKDGITWVPDIEEYENPVYEEDSVTNEARDEVECSLEDLLNSKIYTIYYEYDLGDSWTFKVELIDKKGKDTADSNNVISLIDGKGAGPLEDSGGISGYAEIVKNQQKFIENKTNFNKLHIGAKEGVLLSGEYNSTEWILLTTPWWQGPNFLDIKAINFGIQIKLCQIASAPKTEKRTLFVQTFEEALPSGVLYYYLSHYVRANDKLSGILDNSNSPKKSLESTIGAIYSILKKIDALDNGLVLTSAGNFPSFFVKEIVQESNIESDYYDTFYEKNYPFVRNMHEVLKKLKIIKKYKDNCILTKETKAKLGTIEDFFQHLAAKIIKTMSSQSEYSFFGFTNFLIDVLSDDVKLLYNYESNLATLLSYMGYSADDYGGYLNPEDVSNDIFEYKDILRALNVFSSGHRSDDFCELKNDGKGIVGCLLAICLTIQTSAESYD
jgi:hypothetical protein